MTEATVEKPEKKPKLVYFNLDSLDTMKRKRLINLSRRIGIKPNKPNDSMRQELREYYETNKDLLETLKKALDEKRRATAKKREPVKDSMKKTPKTKAGKTQSGKSKSVTKKKNKPKAKPKGKGKSSKKTGRAKTTSKSKKK